MGVPYLGVGPGWTDERIETLKKLHADGLSCSQIATQMKFITRNAVIGKLTRLGLNMRSTASAPRRLPAAKPPRPPKAQRASPPKALAPPKLVGPDFGVEEPLPPDVDIKGLRPIALEERCKHHCKWPIGDPRDAAYGDCGRAVSIKPNGRPETYCPDHKFTGVAEKQPKTRANDSLAGWIDSMEGRRSRGSGRVPGKASVMGLDFG